MSVATITAVPSTVGFTTILTRSPDTPDVETVNDAKLLVEVLIIPYSVKLADPLLASSSSFLANCVVIKNLETRW